MTGIQSYTPGSINPIKNQQEQQDVFQNVETFMPGAIGNMNSVLSQPGSWGMSGFQNLAGMSPKGAVQMAQPTQSQAPTIQDILAMQNGYA